MYDGMLKLWTLIKNPEVLDWMDEIEMEVLSWKNTTVHLHKYGGLQFNYEGKEIGHIHSNGLLDMLLSRKIKAELMAEGRIQDHHSFKKSGWISFYIETEGDRDYAIWLLRFGYETKAPGKKLPSAVKPTPKNPLLMLLK
jgi:hypothetical protein